MAPPALAAREGARPPNGVDSRAAMVAAWESSAFLKKWAARWPRDPYYNPNFNAEACDYSLIGDDSR